jgi:hypothetical protein
MTFLWQNQLDALISQIYSGNETLHVSDSSSVHNQEQDKDGTTYRPEPAQKLSANLYDIYHYCVYSTKLQMMERGTVQNM